MKLNKSISLIIVLAVILTGVSIFFLKSDSPAEKVESRNVQQISELPTESEPQQDPVSAEPTEKVPQSGAPAEAATQVSIDEEFAFTVIDESAISKIERFIIVEGIVDNKVGESIEGATIEISVAGALVEKTVSDSEGQYQIKMSAVEEFEISASKEDYADERYLISSISALPGSANEEQEMVIDFTLKAPQNYIILVQNEELEPVADAVVWIEKRIERKNTFSLEFIEKRSTDQQGMFKLENWPENEQYFLTAIHSDYAMQETRLQLQTVITLEKEGLNAEIKVTNQETLAPASSVTFEVEYLSSHSGRQHPLDRRTVTTNADGGFELKGLLSGHYQFSINSNQYAIKSNYGDPDSLVIQLYFQPKSPFEIFVHEGYELSGTVTDQDHHPLSGVHVTIDSGQVLAGRTNTAITDDKGGYEFSGIKSQSIGAVFEKEKYKTILAGKPIDHAKVQLRPGSSNSTQLQLFAPVTVKVVNSKDEPVPEIEVKYYSASRFGRDKESFAGKTDGEGISSAIIPMKERFRAEAIYQGLAYSSDMILSTQENLEKTHVIRVSAGGSVFGKVTTEDGKPVANIELEYHQQRAYEHLRNSEAITQRTNGNGEYRFDRLPSGQGRIRILSDEFEAKDHRFDLETETELEADLIVWPFAELAGHVINSDQKPVQDATVHQFIQNDHISTKTDENGYFYFEKVSTLERVTLTVDPPTIYYKRKSQIKYTPNDLDMVIELEDQLPLVLIGTLIDDITREPILDYKVRKDTHPPIEIDVVNGEFTEYVRGYQRGVYYQFSVNGDAYQRIWVRPSITDEQAEKGELRYEFVYQSSQTLEGMVVDQDTGSPISGVTVGALTDTDVYAMFFDPFSPQRRISESDTAITGEDGRFQIVGNYPNPMAIRFDPPEGYKRTYIITPLKSGKTVLEDKVELEKDSPLEIQVINRHTNTPLANRKVTLTSRIETTGSREQVTDAQGIARFNDLNRTTILPYEVRVDGIDHLLYLKLRKLDGNRVVMDVGNATIKLSAIRNGELIPINGGIRQNRYGNIKNISPSSPKDSEILIFDHLANGNYYITISYEIDEQRYFKQIDIEVDHSGTVDKVIELGEYTLRGIVRREDGKPHEISKITWSIDDRSNSAPANEAGEFSLSGLEVGEITINAIKDKYEHVASKTITIIPDQNDYYAEIIIPSKGTAKLNAHVTSGVTDHGVPNLFARLIGIDENGLQAGLALRASGGQESKIEITEIPAGLYQLSLGASDHVGITQELSISEGEHVVLDEQLQPSGVLKWTVSNAVGENSDHYSITIKQDTGVESDAPFSQGLRQYWAVLPLGQYTGQVFDQENVLIDTQSFKIDQGIVTYCSTQTKD